jgi:hypothetical protein
MAISAFPAPAAGGADTIEAVAITVANSAFVINKPGLPGLYEFKAISNTAATPTGTIRFLDSNSAEISVFSLLDYDTGSTANESVVVARLEVEFSKIVITLNLVSTVVITSYQTPSAAEQVTITAFNTTQTVVRTTTNPAILLGGGGGGGRGSNTNTGGGGSGYIEKFSVAPGTYSLVVGAGGGGEGDGSASTFNGLTAAGGSRGTNSAGGAGGSGGGQGTGGANGANGSGAGGGVGSGVTLPFWRAPGVGGGTHTAGGFYAGGGGISSTSASGTSGAANTGGGGGAAGSSGGTAGGGGSGVLLIAEGL